MCVATIVNCFAPHTSCSLRKITRLCDAQQCASSHVTFGILNMLVVVRSAPYLYLRIEGDPWIELYRLRYHIYICQIIAGTKYITNYNSLRTYLHFRCSIQNIILKLTDTATGTSHIRTILASINHVISGTIVLCTVGHHSYWKSSRSQIVWSPTADASVE